ncbi:endoribonuclease L-PSP [Mollisia scopiformis]|uniref:Endoribonuclease L-PSP n=1 Tax=Mollisia scopiformis TaxID=149040 RepID=A0A194XLG8_MOLSC|nr:endoribonuclease L-PSP [Mollisia scopiformis]KUJ21023.1 endoribonuclease L-PSP [Mollisia scopiformis]
MATDIQEIRTTNAPAPLPVFSQAIKANGMVFVSGNIGFNVETWTLVEGGIQAQTDQTLKNIKAVLEEAGSSFEKILKLNVYIKDFGDFKAMNETYITHFPGRKPARTCVAVADLPFNAIVEMECTALCD